MPSATAHPMDILNYGNQAGGGTVHYGALSWRMHEDDFRARSHTIERYGASAIPQDSSVADWPLCYADLEPFYDQRRIRTRRLRQGRQFAGPQNRRRQCVRGAAQARISAAAIAGRQSGVLFAEGTRKLGYHPFSSPRAILSQPYNDRASCTYCGFCQAFGCHVGAKSSILVTKLPEADATGNFKLLTGAMCYRVNSDNSGHATGVSYYGPDGSENTIEAELVILAPFIYDNTRLLLLSKTDKFPNGLANSSGQVGKHLMAHIMAERVRRLRRQIRQRLHGSERAETHHRRFQRRQFRS